MTLEPNGSEPTKRQDLEETQQDEATDEVAVDVPETADKSKPTRNAPQIQLEGMVDPSLDSSRVEASEDPLDNISGGVHKMIGILEQLRDGATEIMKTIKSDSDGNSDDSAESDAAGSDDDQDDEVEQTLRGHLIFGARQCDYAEFKESAKGQRKHVLDYLLAGNELLSESLAWKERHLSAPLIDVNNFASTRPKAQTKASGKAERKVLPKDPIQDRWIHRVRINSITVNEILWRFAAEAADSPSSTKNSSQSLLFVRPFSFLLHCQTKMREELTALENQLRTAELSDDSAPEFQHQRASLAELQIYVEFVEQKLVPEYQKYKSSQPAQATAQPSRARFEDLWYLFEPGELVYIPPNASRIYKDLSAYQYIGRVYRVQQPTLESQDRSPRQALRSILKSTSQADPFKDSPRDSFNVAAYHLEFDGDQWGAVSRPAITIPRFEGEKEVSTLPVYPLRFLGDYEKMLDKAIADGKSVVDLIGARLVFYEGWSLITTPLGTSIPSTNASKKGGDGRSPTHIGSDVLLDYQETFNTAPEWKPEDFKHILPDRGLDTIRWEKTLPNLEWPDLEKKETPLRLTEKAMDWDGIDLVRAEELSKHDGYLRESKIKLPSGDDFALIPRRVYGYSVWKRQFFHLNIRSMQQRSTEGAGLAFSQLQVDPDHKQLIKSLIQSHFNKKTFATKHHIELDGQDLIRGKGKGLVILLHGVPGVGKTATAEAVAQKWGKPLFPITCGDLGVTPDSVEEALNEVFRLAHLWDCILLLDEADVFITERKEVGDLQRNGLVSGMYATSHITLTIANHSHR